MKIEQAGKKDLYYTEEHEWVDFQGTIAYVGVCAFKLTGFKEIHKLSFPITYGFLRKGEVLATILYGDYQVDVQMPVDGKLQQLNKELISGDRNTLLKQSEGAAWIALIIPAMPYERKGLLLPKEYRPNGKGKYAKS
jgi:glycine cleavage system H protein